MIDFLYRYRRPTTMQEKHQTFPTAPEAFLLVIAAFLLEYLVDMLLSGLQGVLGLDQMALATLGRLMAYGLLFGALLEWKGLSYTSLFHPSPLPLRPHVTSLLLPVLMLTPGLLLAEGELVSVLDDLISLPVPEELKAFFSNPSLAILVLTCLLAPVLEEMLFRGIVLRSFLLQYERRSAMLGSAVVFGFAHLNSIQFVVAFTMGLVLGWLYERTRSLWPGILLHMAFNTGSILLENDFGAVDVSPGTMLGWGAVSALAMLYLYRRLVAPR